MEQPIPGQESAAVTETELVLPTTGDLLQEATPPAVLEPAGTVETVAPGEAEPPAVPVEAPAVPEVPAVPSPEVETAPPVEEDLLGHLQSEVAKRDEQIASLQAELGQRDQQMEGLRDQVAQQEKTTASLQEKLIQKEAQVSELTERVNDLTGQFQRLSADFDNFRRRSTQERENLVKFAGERVFTNLLPIIDNFGRATQSAGGLDPQALLQGIEAMVNQVKGLDMIRRQLDDLMQKSGVAPIPTVGQRFDPNFHEAVMLEETTEHPDQTIIAELQTGYALSGKVIRAAMVKVASNPTAAAPPVTPAAEPGPAELPPPAAAEATEPPPAVAGADTGAWEQISQGLGGVEMTVEEVPPEDKET